MPAANLESHLWNLNRLSENLRDNHSWSKYMSVMLLLIRPQESCLKLGGVLYECECMCLSPGLCWLQCFLDQEMEKRDGLRMLRWRKMTGLMWVSNGMKWGTCCQAVLYAHWFQLHPRAVKEFDSVLLARLLSIPFSCSSSFQLHWPKKSRIPSMTSPSPSHPHAFWVMVCSVTTAIVIHWHGQSELRDVDMFQRFDVSGFVNHFFWCDVSWIGGAKLSSFEMCCPALVWIQLYWPKSWLYTPDRTCSVGRHYCFSFYSTFDLKWTDYYMVWVWKCQH